MADRSQRLTKRQQKLSERKSCSLYSLNIDLKPIEPITNNQKVAFRSNINKNHIFMLGSAGTGKTFLSVYFALQEILDHKTSTKKLIIIRSSQPTKNIGFLKGDEKQKMEVYEAPYRAIVNDLCGRDDAYEMLKIRGVIEFQSTSFLRGITFEDSIILFDEAQSALQIEWVSVLTRVGEGSRVLICGDTKQDDLTSERYKESTGIYSLIDVFDSMEDTELIEFTEEDIVRSGFVKSLIIAMNRLGI